MTPPPGRAATRRRRPPGVRSTADTLLRAPPRRAATTGGAPGRPGPTGDRLVARVSTDLWRRRARSIAIFIHGDGPQAQGQLVANSHRPRTRLTGGAHAA